MPGAYMWYDLHSEKFTGGNHDPNGTLWSVRESNSYLRFRKPPFYPLN